MKPGSTNAGVQPRLWKAGRTGWALVGIAAALVVAWLVLAELAVVVVPLVLALFPATLLVPVADWLKRRRAPAALAALLALLGGLALIGLVVGLMVPLVAMELPELTESASEGLGELQQFLDEQFGLEIGGISELIDEGAQLLGEAGDVAAQGMQAAAMAVETIAGMLIMLVILFFYLKDGRRLARSLTRTAPSHLRPAFREIGGRAWTTLTAYFRGQLLVALVDAVFIGLGLLLLGVPLALPLAVLIFFGGLFPVVGAIATGALAVLVALADGGLVTGLIVLGLILAVQQLEANVLQPYVLGQAISLHPMMVLLAITAGAIAANVLGAFLAVPAAAIIARAIDYLREETQTEAPGASGQSQQPS
ncbi:AI-2E family transporter [Egibacter rhizosphaerae]|uniref:AI-2E family transporter n=1 Tax=Egibacter rhizosphaerae TaxID=1670831 RepID=UPI0013F163C1|nr:AI-2E family transporter [Egibacter rhizosphaerae]